MPALARAWTRLWNCGLVEGSAGVTLS